MKAKLKMNWRIAFRRGRAPSLIQMRLLQTVAVPTPGPQIEDHYKHVFGFEVARATIYGTLSTMHERGWIDKARDPQAFAAKVYSITGLGISVLVDGATKYGRIAEASRARVRRRERAHG